jgi:hypothetical protein
MKKIILSITLLLISILGFSQDYAEGKKIRKMTFSDFTTEFGINDTATVVIDIFFDKKDNGAYGEMIFLPISAGIYAIPQTRGIGAVLGLVSVPLFLHGTYTLIRFRKKKLYKVLSHYKTSKQLPNWIQRKVDKRLTLYKVMDREY